MFLLGFEFKWEDDSQRGLFLLTFNGGNGGGPTK